MVNVIFKFDKEKDLWNNWFAINFKSELEEGRKFNNILQLQEICEDKNFEECREEIEKFHEKIYSSYLINETLKSFQSAWEKVNDKFFERLENITGNKFPFESVTAYLTTQNLCPYDFKKGSFIISIWSNLPNMLRTSAHELMHLDFHNNNWREIKEKIGKEKTEKLKEALTVLLNLEFRDLWFVKDKGKNSEEQQELREFIKNEWLKNKNYKSLIDKCVIYLKR